MKKIIRTKGIFLALVLLFAAPGLLALVFYKHPAWLAALPTNKGEFIRPAMPLNILDNPKEKWSMALWCPVGCHTPCVKALDQLARTRLALGRRLYQVDLWMLQPERTAACSPEMQQAFDKQAINLRSVSVDEQSKVDLLKSEMRMFLVDPNHFMVLKYSSENKPEDIFHDLKRLLSSQEQS
ncbi:MAG: hypothetical protein P1U36_01970 [Legionellaceae bacterium]|nr:hypothetical protein [Legionellaceae bacterium]